MCMLDEIWAKRLSFAKTPDGIAFGFEKRYNPMT